MARRKPKSTKALWEEVLANKAMRQEVTRQSHAAFFPIFLNHYIHFEIAPFQQEMFQLTENPKHKLIVIMAFRGSGKSTIMNLSYTLWSILGAPQKKFVLIIGNTQSQAKNDLQNIRYEIQDNELLRRDMGPFEYDDSVGGASSLVFPKLGVRIMAVSRDFSMRGTRYGAERPDLIICDDVESLASVESIKDRDANYDWLVGEVIPAGDTHTQVVVLGNLLGEDSLLMRLRADILSKKTRGIFRAYPFYDDNDLPLWPAKFNTQKKLEEFELGVTDAEVWNREYLLLYTNNSIADLSRRSEAIKEGKDPDADRPIQKLGRYQISAPHGVCTLFSEINRSRLQEWETLSATDPAQAIGRLRVMTDDKVSFSYQNIKPNWSTSWVSLRTKGMLKTIIRAALCSENETAQRQALLSIKELISAGYPEFQELLEKTRDLVSFNNLE